MNLVHQQMQNILAGIRRSDVMTLKYASVWLRTDIFDPEMDAVGCEEPFIYAVQQCRQCWPEIVTEVMQMYWRGCAQMEMEIHLLSAVNSHLVEELGDLEYMSYGIPISCYAVGHETTEDDWWVESYPELELFWSLIGAMEGETQESDFRVCRVLRNRLKQYPEGSIAHDMHWLAAWAGRMSGNSCIDETRTEQDDIRCSSGDLMEWTPENVATANAMNQEAAEIYEAAHIALLALNNSEAWRAALHRNAMAIRQGKKHGTKWPESTKRRTSGRTRAATRHLPGGLHFDETNPGWV